MSKFYMTLGRGQPLYPGYFICEADNESHASKLTYETLDGRWCNTYLTLDDVHPMDRIYRGTITEQGIGE